MELAVVKLDLDVDHLEAGAEPLVHRGPHSFFDRGDPLVRDRASENLVGEDEALTSLERLDTDAADAVLAVPTRLLDVAPQRLCLAAKGGAVGDLERNLLDLDRELRLEPVQH